jgi:hypothetical protein
MNNIEEILEKYWNAESSIEEENVLKAYFNSDNVSEGHLPFKSFFTFIDKEVALRSDFNPLAKLDAIKLEKVEQVKEARVISFANRWKAVAAILIFSLVSLWAVNFFLKPAEVEQEVVSTKKARIIEINDIDEAKLYTEDAVNLIASLLQSSTNQVVTGMEAIDNSPVIGSIQ